eukprot:c4377_g2_i1.p1 GENE.c4377_g2_i1~~c4377_g2_i1.p1  ORF type:complete len:317 (+),score=58.10 c4377_g2_i1:62-952(+)
MGYQYMNRVAFAIGFLISLAPTLSRLSKFGFSVPESIFGLVVLIASYLCCSICGALNFTYVFMAYIDYDRRLQLLRACGDLLRPINSSNEQGRQEWSRPPLDLGFYENISSWNAIRSILSDLGLRFQKRLNYYAGFYLGLVLCIIVMFLEAILISKESDFATNKKKQLEHSVATWIFWTWFPSFLACIAAIIQKGADSNEECGIHQLLLTEAQITLAERMMLAHKSSSHELLKALEECGQLLSHVIRWVEVHSNLFPVTFLGIRASSQFTGFLITATFTGAAAILKFLYNIDIGML